MDVNFTQLAERRLLAAVAEGKLSHLQGEGRPLPLAPPALYVTPEEAIGMKIMSEAGYLPREIALRKELAELRAEYKLAPERVRHDLLSHMADVEMRESIAREARLKLTRHGL